MVFHSGCTDFDVPPNKRSRISVSSPTLVIFCCFDGSHPNGCEVASHCSLVLHFPRVRKIPWSRKQQPTPVCLTGESHGQRSLAGYSPWGCRESDRTEPLCTHTQGGRHTLDLRFTPRAATVCFCSNTQVVAVTPAPLHSSIS